MTIRSTILHQISLVASQQGKSLAPLTDNLGLLESGLDSLCVAILVAYLEDELAIDPFEGNVAVPVTVGDLIQLYEHAAAAA